MDFWILLVLHSGGNIKIVIDVDSGVAKHFNSKQAAKKYAIQNCLGVYLPVRFSL